MFRTIAIAAALAFAGAAHADNASAPDRHTVTVAVKFCQQIMPRTPLAYYEMPYCVQHVLSRAQTIAPSAQASAFNAAATLR